MLAHSQRFELSLFACLMRATPVFANELLLPLSVCACVRTSIVEAESRMTPGSEVFAARVRGHVRLPTCRYISHVCGVASCLLHNLWRANMFALSIVTFSEKQWSRVRFSFVISEMLAVFWAGRMGCWYAHIHFHKEIVFLSSMRCVVRMAHLIRWYLWQYSPKLSWLIGVLTSSNSAGLWLFLFVVKFIKCGQRFPADAD